MEAKFDGSLRIMVHSNNTIEQTPGGTKMMTLCFAFDEPAIKVCRVLAYCLVILASFIGNSLLLGVLWREKKRRGTMNYLIANMAIADLVITVVYMPRMITVVILGYEWLVDGTAGLVLCKLVASSHYVALLVSIQTLVVLSLERFLLVVWPFKIPFTTRRAKTIISVIWLVAITVRLPLLVGLETERDAKEGTLRCRDRLNALTGNSESRRIYDHVLGVAFYALPVVIMAVLYSAAAFKLKKPYSLRNTTAHNRREYQRRTRQNNRVFIMLLVITIAFILCWVTYFVARRGVIGVRALPCNVLFIRIFLAHLNCAVTPCIYAVFSEKYQAAFKKLFGRFFCNFYPRHVFLRRRILAVAESQPDLPTESTESVKLKNFK